MIPDIGNDDEGDARLRKLAAGMFIAAVAIAALHFGRAVLIPVAVAILIAFLLGPVVTWMRRLMPLAIAVTLTVLAALLLVFLLSTFATTQLAEVANEVATYQAHLREKIQEIRKLSESGGALGRFMSTIAAIGNELSLEADPAAPTIRTKTSGSPFETIASFVAPVVHPIVTFGMVLILVVFILLDRARLSDQFVRLVGASDVHATAEAITDAAARVGRVLSLQLLTNFGFGVLVAGGLYAMGMPNAVLWGLLGAAFRFIPYAGAVLAAVLPAVIALAVTPGWIQPFLVLGWIVVCEAVIGQIIEPLLFGESTGISPLALIISAIFWGTIWGPVGLLLSTPLAVCLLVLGRHVPQLDFLQILLSNQPALEPYQQIYHRLMRKAVPDALSVTLAEIEKKGREKGLDDSIGRMVVLAEADRTLDRLRPAQIEAIVAGTEEVLELIENEFAEIGAGAAPVSGKPAPVKDGTPATFVCMGGRGQIDNAAAAVIAFALRQRGLAAESHEKKPDNPANQPGAIHVICYASHPSEAVRRYTLRKLTQRGTAVGQQHAVLNYGTDDQRRQSASAGTVEGDLVMICQRLTEHAVTVGPVQDNRSAA